ncbi:MAG TPA: dephospho-CoA kinase [Acidobacteria bacterium]|nr:dephospho-CoA kinase [Acidobacteriota bacterium]
MGSGRRRPCVVGLTGGLASGKSSVARELARLGAAVLDADAVVHELYEPGAPGARAVRELFGEGVLDGRGGVDRGALAARIEREPKLLPRLNAAIHPLVRGRVRRWIDGLAARPEPPEVAVVEATLMIESGSYREYDVLAVVWCRPAQQLERALARGMPEERARTLLAGQMPLDEKRRLAHVVIDNSGSPEELPTRAEEAWAGIRGRCRAI